MGDQATTTTLPPPVEAPVAATGRGRLSGAFWRQWAATGISNLGDGITFVAVGLLALTLTSDERLLALATVMTFVSWVVIALPVGIVIDRLDRQRLMVGANLIRVAAFGSIAVLAVTSNLSIWSLLALLAAVGACEVVFDSTGQALLPMLVPQQQLARANGLFFTAEVIAGSIAGLSLGGILFDIDIGLPFTVNAAGYAAGAALLLTIRYLYVPPVDLTERADYKMWSAIRWLLAHRLLRSIAAMTAATNLGLMLSMGIVAKFAIDELGLTDTEFGILMAINSIGAATGGIVGPRLIDRLSSRAVLGLSYLAVAGCLLAIGVVPPIWLIGTAFFCLGFVISLWNIATLTLRQELIPPDHFGRVNGIYRWVGATSSVVGIVAGGFIAYATTLAMPFLVGGLSILAFGALIARPLLSSFAEAATPAT